MGVASSKSIAASRAELRAASCSVVTSECLRVENPGSANTGDDDSFESCCCFVLRRQPRRNGDDDIPLVEACRPPRGRGFKDEDVFVECITLSSEADSCAAGDVETTDSSRPAPRDGQNVHRLGLTMPAASDWVTYTVRPGDSLLSCAIKFNTDVPSLLRANKLTTPSSFNACLTILVPAASGVDPSLFLEEQAPKEEGARAGAAKVSMLRAAAKLENGNAREHVMSAQEADFYLEEAGGDFQAARRLYLEDLRWEKDGGQTSRHALLAAVVIEPQTWSLVMSQ